jgi:photosystem II stability/assembly factor-like uncharacterized protein
MGDYSLAGEGAIWLQRDGPNTEPVYLGCHETGDIQEPKGEVKLYYCPDPNKKNNWIVSDSSQGAPGLISTTISSRLRAVKDVMNSMVCPGAMFVHHVGCGKPNNFNSWDYTYLLRRPRVQQRTLTKLTAMNPDSQDQAMQSWDIQAETMADIYKLLLARVAVTATDSLLDIADCGNERCDGDCGVAQNTGDNLYAASGSLAGSPANMSEVLASADSAGTWTLAGYPFNAGEVVNAIRCFAIDDSTNRILAMRGTTDGANPAEVAVSDDGGHTWTNVDLGTVVAMYGLGPKSLVVIDYYHIWAVTTGGHIYFSNDGGSTWTEQTSGTAQNLYAIHMVNDQYGWIVGANNTILKTSQQGAGGVNIWAAVTGPSLQAAVTAYSVHCFSAYRMWISYADGKLWYTRDGGTTFYQRQIVGVSGGNIPCVTFHDEWLGALVHNNAAGAGVIYITIDGGYSWQALSTPTNAGLNSVIMPTVSLLFAVGNVYGGTSVILRGSVN